MSDQTGATAATPGVDESELAWPGGMHLSNVTIKNFRSLRDVSVDLRPDITVIVGENNAGKSNFVDAVRLATEPLGGRRSRYFQPEDSSRDSTDPVEIRLRFSDSTWIQKAKFLRALDIDSGDVSLTTRFEIPDDPTERIKAQRLGGPANAPFGDIERRNTINHVYVPPVRDAKRDLDTSSAGRLAAIMAYLVSPDDREQLRAKAREYYGELEKLKAISAPSAGMSSLLEALTDAVEPQRMALGFEEPTDRRLAAGLRVKMSDAGLDPEDLAASGSGYANLLYLASILLELTNARDSELTILLVEEPEAHLHPQLQGVLLDFLRQHAGPTTRGEFAHNPSRVQVILTTHSPNISSAAGIDHISSFKRHGIDSSNRATFVTPLWEIGLKAADVNKLNRYLSVTRSSLLFSRRVVLVEGLSESLLIPSMARCYARLSIDAAKRDAALRKLSGSTIVAIDSVDFKPYVKLLLGGGAGASIADEIVIVTDGDPAPSLSAQAPGQTPGALRATELILLAKELANEHALRVAVGDTTFEADFAAASPRNGAALKLAYLAQHPRLGPKWDIARGDGSAMALYTAIGGGTISIRKGELAQALAEVVDNGVEVDLPTYLKPAIDVALGLSTP